MWDNFILKELNNKQHSIKLPMRRESHKIGITVIAAANQGEEAHVG